MTHSNLSRIDERKPHRLYEVLFSKLLKQCQRQTSGNRFKFKNPLYSFDASAIDRCLSVFPLDDFRSSRGTIKLHVGLNHDAYLPEFVAIGDSCSTDITAGHRLNFPKGSIIASNDMICAETAVSRAIKRLSSLALKSLRAARYDFAESATVTH